MKELEDHTWFPPVLRNFQTDFTGFVAVHSRVYDVFINYLKGLKFSPAAMTDLCSGSGEPAISIFKKSGCFTKLVLTDMYPRKISSGNGICYEPESMDVLQMEFNKDSCYTMFNAFHHFSDEEKIRVINSIRESGATAFIVELLEPDFFCMLKILLLTTLGTLLLSPFIRPFSFTRLLLTYIIPVNVFTICYDGIVSVLKSRSVEHYKKLFSDNKSVKVSGLENWLNRLVVIEVKPL